MVGGLTPHLLGGHVPHRAENGAFRGAIAAWPVGRGEFRDPEIEDLEPSLMRHKEVLRLEIAVDDALVVGGAQSLRELETVVDGLR